MGEEEGRKEKWKEKGVWEKGEKKEGGVMREDREEREKEGGEGGRKERKGRKKREGKRKA